MTARRIAENPQRRADGVADSARKNAQATSGGISCLLSATVYTAPKKALPKKMQRGSGPPKFCWVCGKQLQRAPGKGLGLFYFNRVIDQGGVEHRVHGFPCTETAIHDGAKVNA